MTLNVTVLDELRDRQAKILAAGGEEKIRARHTGPDDGARTSRRAVPGRRLFRKSACTFQRPPVGHVEHKDLPADGVVVGTGYVGGRAVAAFSPGLHRRRRHAREDARQKIVRVMQDGGAIRHRRSSPSRIPAAPAFRKAWTRCRATATYSTRTCCSPASCRRSRSSAAPARAAPPIRRR